MATVEEMNSRTPTCRKCGAQFRVIIPSDLEARRRLLAAHAQNRMRFVRELRELTDASLEDAKGVMLHLVDAKLACHWCGAELEPSTATDCRQCGSLNISFDGVTA